ncbi:hypothetical protein EAG14_15745 [Acidovorax sp. 1608163]|nr:hypothetical protein EAG14_15745 [Acidovorax sp. 1608163]
MCSAPTRVASSGCWCSNEAPLSRFAPSPSLAAREGDDALAAGRPLLGVHGYRLRRLRAAFDMRSSVELSQ